MLNGEYQCSGRITTANSSAIISIGAGYCIKIRVGYAGYGGRMLWQGGRGSRGGAAQIIAIANFLIRGRSCIAPSVKLRVQGLRVAILGKARQLVMAKPFVVLGIVDRGSIAIQGAKTH